MKAAAMEVTGSILTQGKSDSSVHTPDRGSWMGGDALPHPAHSNKSRNAPTCYTLRPKLYFRGYRTVGDKVINDLLQGKLHVKAYFFLYFYLSS